MDVIRPPRGAIWGRWNNRFIQPGWVTGLVNAFKARFDNCVDDRSMAAVVDPAWLARPVPVPDPKNPDAAVEVKEPWWVTVQGFWIDDVPVIKFTPGGLEAIKDDNLWILGGNHRRHALNRFLIVQQEEVGKLEAEIADMRKKNEEGGPDGMVGLLTDDISAKSKVLSKKKEELLVRKKWPLLLYNRSTYISISGRSAGTDASHD